MVEITITDKQKYLNEHCPFAKPPKLTDLKKCIHCERKIFVIDFKVFKDEDGEEYICCPYAPECNGTVVDWIDV